MRADLHMHSVCSDGLLPPAALAERIKAGGLSLFSLTDHDNMGGNAEASAEAKRLGLHFVRGIEVSAYLGGAKVHMLGYGCREGEAYFEFLRERIDGAKLRAEDAIRKANACFSMHVTLADVEARQARADAPLHTMHVVRTYAALRNADVGELYRAYFAPGRPAFSEICRPTPSDALRIIHAMGGKAVLAHPAQILLLPQEVGECYHSFGEEERRAVKKRYAGARNALMEQLADEGLDGIECFHPTHTAEETEELSGFARAHGLFVTGGSDFHADGTARRIGYPAFDADEIAELLLSLEGSI